MNTSNKISLLLCALCALCGESFSQRIAFVSPTKTGWQLFTTNPDGAETKQLSNGEYDVREPDWFPQRDRIAFTTTDGNVYIVNEATGDITDTIASDELYFWQVAVNNDGSELYLTGGKPENADYTSIYRYSVTDKKTALELQLRTPIYHLDVSKNNDILFANTQCGGECKHIIQEIWFREIGTGNTCQKTLLNSLSRYPKWAPDGETFVFDSEVNSYYRMYTQKKDEKTAKQLPSSVSGHHNYTHPSLSPDGKQLLFLVNGKLHRAPLENPEQMVKITPFSEKPDARIKDCVW